MEEGLQKQPQSEDEVKKPVSTFKKYIPLIIGVIFSFIGLMVFLSIFSRNSEIRKAENVSQENNIQPLASLLPDTEDVLRVAIGDIENEIDEDRYYYHNDGSYINYSLFDINLNTKELSSDRYVNDEIEAYSGIPFVDNEVYSTVIVSRLSSQDKTESLVWIGTKNHNEPVDGAYGGYYINEEAPLTYRCEVFSKTCEQISTIPISPRAVTEPKKNNLDRFYNGPSRYWLKWDNESGRLLGHYHGEGGPSSPVYVLDTDKKEVYTVCGDEKGCPGLGFANWDNDASQVFVVDYKYGEPQTFEWITGGESIRNRRHTYGQIFQYDSEKNNYVWKKEFDLSSIDSQPYKSYDNPHNYLRYAIFSRDNNHVLLLTSRNIYSLSLESGEITHLVDATPAIEIQKEHGGIFAEHKQEVRFSPSGRYVYFIGKEEKSEKSTLYTIDLLNNFEVELIVTADYINTR